MKSINFIIPGDIDAAASRNASAAIEVRSRHQCVRAAPIVNNYTGISTITVQPLIALRGMILGANYPDDHVITAIGRGDKRRTATATCPGHTPTAGDVDCRRIGRSNAEGGEDGVAVVVARNAT